MSLNVNNLYSEVKKKTCLAFCFYQRHKLKLQAEYRKYKIGCLLILK